MEKVLTPQEQFTPQQAYPGYPGVSLPKGWIPYPDVVLRLMGVYDNKSGTWVGLPLQAFIEGLVKSEQLNPLGKIDSRQKVTLTVPSGTGIGTYATRKYITVPTGELWFVSSLVLVTPAKQGGTVYANVRIVNWPDSAATPDKDGLPYWAADQGADAGKTATAKCYEDIVAADDDIGAPIRLPPGATLALCASVTGAALTADCDVTLTPYGWKGKLLAPVS